MENSLPKQITDTKGKKPGLYLRIMVDDNNWSLTQELRIYKNASIIPKVWEGYTFPGRDGGNSIRKNS